jgi:hypothetical protein
MALNLSYLTDRNVLRTDARLTLESHAHVYDQGIDANTGAMNGWRH